MWKDRVNSILQPLRIIPLSIKLHLAALKHLLSTTGITALTQISEIQNLGVATLLRTCQEPWIQYEDTTAVPKLLLSTAGVTLDIGPGIGNQIHRLPAQNITTIYGVEPNPQFTADISARLAKFDLQDKYTLVTCGIEDSDVLEEHGITEGSMDTVLCIQVLCSVDDPRRVMKEVWRLLKPGGRLVFWEHGRSKDFWTRVIQACWNRAWCALVGGCRLNRDIKPLILAAGEWENPDDIVQDDEIYSLLPRTWGLLVKKA